MPIIKSAIKRVKINKKANMRNSSEKSAMRTAIKKFEKAVHENSNNIEQLHQKAVSTVDKALSKKLIKANKASREKSKMSQKLNTNN